MNKVEGFNPDANDWYSVDGSIVVGPSWQGIFGKTETFEDGGSAVVDVGYLRESIVDPAAKLVAGFANSMPANFFPTPHLTPPSPCAILPATIEHITKATIRKSTCQSGIQRGGGCCKAAISAGEEWAGEPATEIQFTDH